MGEQDQHMSRKTPVRTRRGRVRDFMLRIQDIKYNNGDSLLVKNTKTAKTLSDVCEPDERMTDNVINWARDEARTLVEEFKNLRTKKLEHQEASDEDFIKNCIMTDYVMKRAKELHLGMEESERHMRYATKVHERMAERDQETLAKYILVLEAKMHQKMVEKHKLRVAVHHLRSESDAMRFSDDEQKEQQLQLAGPSTIREEGNNGDDAFMADGVDDDKQPNIPPPGGAVSSTGLARDAAAPEPDNIRRPPNGGRPIDLPKSRLRTSDPDAVLDASAGSRRGPAFNVPGR